MECVHYLLTGTFRYHRDRYEKLRRCRIECVWLNILLCMLLLLVLFVIYMYRQPPDSSTRLPAFGTFLLFAFIIFSFSFLTCFAYYLVIEWCRRRNDPLDDLNETVEDANHRNKVVSDTKTICCLWNIFIFHKRDGYETIA
jgi:hypothetical protein